MVAGWPVLFFIASNLLQYIQNTCTRSTKRRKYLFIKSMFLFYFQGKFTCKSDVWSFAVTLWEILTFAREQPFETLSDEQVIENAGHYYRNDNEQIYHSHPPICPKEIYDLMLECWNRQESERPSFREIHMFLMRKNMGYDPRKDNLEHVGIADVSVC